MPEIQCVRRVKGVHGMRTTTGKRLPFVRLGARSGHRDLGGRESLGGRRPSEGAEAASARRRSRHTRARLRHEGLELEERGLMGGGEVRELAGRVLAVMGSA